MQNIFNIDERELAIFFSKIFSADVTTVWNYYTKPELLAKWWMPKPWKFELVSQDFSEGGKLHYAAVGPNGEKHFSGANYHEIHQNRSISLSDYFTDEKGTLNSDMPASQWLIGFTGVEEGTKVTINIHFKNEEELNKTVEMGFREGLLQAADQLQEILSNETKNI